MTRCPMHCKTSDILQSQSLKRNTQVLLVRKSIEVSFSVALLFCAVGGFYFRLFWNEAHETERGFGASTQRFLSPNEFGTASKLGVPIFDLSSGVGHRLPANNGLPMTGVLLLRHLLPAELIVLLALTVALALALTTVNLLLVLKGTTDRLSMYLANTLLLAPFSFYLVSRDYFFNAIGYCSLIAATTILFAPLDVAPRASSPYLTRALLKTGMLSIAIGATVGSQWILLAVMPFILIRARAVIRAIVFIRLNRQLWTTLLGVVGCLVVSYGLLALRLSDLREYSTRPGYESFLVSLDGTLGATKHTIGMLVVRDVPGLAYFSDRVLGINLIGRFYGGLFQLPSGIGIGVIAVLTRAFMANRHWRDVGTWITALFTAVALCVLPGGWLPIGVSYQDVYLLVPFILSTTLITSPPKQLAILPRPLELRRHASLVVRTVWFTVVISWVFWGVSQRTMEFSNYEPTPNGALTSIVDSPTERFVPLLSSVGHQSGFRVMTVTDRFRYEAFEQGRSVHYYGMYSWDDLTENSIPILPYINRLQAISLLAPYSHLNGSAEKSFTANSTSDQCQSIELEFLSVQSLMVDEDYLRVCESSKWEIRPLPDPDDQLLGPVYVTRPTSYRVFGSDNLYPSKTCPFMFVNCIEQLGWRAYESSTQEQPPLRVLNPDSHAGSIAEFSVPEEMISGPRYLVIPVIADPALRVKEAMTGREVATMSAAGFVAIDLSMNDSIAGSRLMISVRPDADLWMVALTPWVWTGFLIVALGCGFRKLCSAVRRVLVKQRL